MSNLFVLDCTLREGGYVNSWNFGRENILGIINGLSDAGIEYIECGFLKQDIYNPNLAIFTDINELKNILPVNSNKIYTLMINYGEFDIEDLPVCPSENIALRIAFKKSEITEAIEYCNQIKNKGYKVFVNPMHTYSYSADELINVVKLTNEIAPYAFTIVDTTGAMKEKDISSAAKIIDEYLNPNIILAFHSHNNLQLSLSNAQYLINLNNNRDLIIDSTLFGMGRGAGNLYTEILTQYINDNRDGKYDTKNIFKIIDDKIKPIYEKTPWGYSAQYHISAENNCHPSYAKYLIDKKNISAEMTDKILKQIPENKKTNFDMELIETLYMENCTNILIKGAVK